MKENLFSMTKIHSYKNMPDLIAETLKEAILHGKFKGGVQLKQDEIAKQFDASLIPVREALIQLEAKGLVKCIRNKGAIVTNLSIEEMRELFELRKILEVGVVTLMDEAIDQEQLSKMKYILAKMENEKDISVVTRHNRLFHQLLCDMAHNKQLSETYQNLFVRVERYLMYSYHLIPNKHNGFKQHEEMVHLLEKNQRETLIKYIVRHIDEGQEQLIDYINKQEKYEKFEWNEFIPFQ